MLQVAIIEKYFLFSFICGQEDLIFPNLVFFKREEELKSEFSIDHSESFWKYLNSLIRHKKSLKK